MPMKEHPRSVWSGGGIPSGDAVGRPTPSDVEAWGATWKEATDEWLIGFAARQHGVDAATAMPALIESQRRLKGAIEVFNRQSGEQTQTVIALTKKVERLTFVITLLTSAAVIFGLIQASAAAGQLYRWYRGW